MRNVGKVATRAATSFGLLALTALPFLTWSCPAFAYDKHACLAASDAAQAFRLDGKLQKARAQFLVCADPSCPSLVQSACAQWLNGLDAQIPSVVVHVREADGRDAVDAQVLMDGKTLPGSTGGTAVSIDPGKHEFRFLAPDGRVTTEALVIAEGEQHRRVDVVLPPRPGAAAGTTGGDGAGGGPGGQTSSTPWLAWGFAGGAVVSWAAFAGFAVSGNHEYAQAKDNCPTASCSSQYPTTKFIAADVALGVAIAATGVATVLFLTHHSEPAVAKAASVLTTGVEF
jgi:hypothetical protein